MHDIQPDYARLRALYRIPPAARTGHTLELCLAGASVLGARAWPGGTLTVREIDAEAIATAAEGLAPAGRRYDYIVAHEVIDAVAAAYPRAPAQGRERLLRRLTEALADGGLIAGSVANRYALSRLAGRNPRARGAWTVFSLSTALRRAQLRDIRIYNLFRHPDLPRFAFNVEPTLSRSEARHHLESVKPFLSARQYRLRSLLAPLAINPFVEDTLWFWARKA